MLYSIPYDHYRDNDTDNLGPKAKVAVKRGLKLGAFCFFNDICFFKYPTSYTDIALRGIKWPLLCVLGSVTYSGFVWAIANNRKKDGPMNYFLAGTGPALVGGLYAQKSLTAFLIGAGTGLYGATRKFYVKEYNADYLLKKGYYENGDLDSGKFQIYDKFLKRTFNDEDHGQRRY